MRRCLGVARKDVKRSLHPSRRTSHESTVTPISHVLLALDPRLPRDPELAHGCERSALRQDVAAISSYLAEQRLINGSHDDPRALRVTVLRRKLGERCSIVSERALDLELHETAEILGLARLFDV